MIPNGFLGSRADFLIDSAIIIFIIIPLIMYYSIRQSRKGRYQTHKNFQVSLLITMLVAIVTLEISIRSGASMEALAKSSFANSQIIKTIFLIHLLAALPTFLSWITLSFMSWRRFQKLLPGVFSNKHELWGKTTFVGLCLTSFTGLILYTMVFVF